MTDETKKCPACAETILAGAILCRFCNTRLDGGPAAPVPAAAAAPLPPKKSGFPVWIIVVLLVACGGIPIVSIIAAIAIPGLLASQRAANERNSSATLKTLTSAEADFRANDRDANGVNDFWVGDVASLFYLKVKGEELRLIEKSAADADALPQAESTTRAPKTGYWYRALRNNADGEPLDKGKGRNPAEFAFTAYPATRSSGKFTYVVCEDNAVYRKDMQGAILESWPTGPDLDGWARLD